MNALYTWFSGFPAGLFYGLGIGVVLEALLVLVWFWRKKKKAVATPGPVGLPWKYCAVMLVVGGAIGTFPWVAQYINSKEQQDMLEQALHTLASKSKQEEDSRIAQAQLYNQSLGPHEYSEIDDADGGEQVSGDKAYDEYLALLNDNGSSFIGTLEIPSINVELPIFHGTSPDVLKKGVGHVYHTALPVGGETTHSVLSAHSGLAGWKFFTDFDQLNIGDQWTVTVYQQKFTYRVISKKVVLPEQVGVLAPKQGKDLMSLVTCTPVGINSHRIIVTGERVK